MRNVASGSVSVEGLCNAHGLAAADVLSVSHGPLPTPAWLDFDGAVMSVSGSCLPPEGRPESLAVIFEPGVVGRLIYPQAMPEVGAQYWYWPNGELSGFRVEVDLSASAPGSEAFTFQFATRDAAGRLTALPNGRIWLPRDLEAFVGFPIDSTQLTRVQTFPERRLPGITGYNAFRAAEAIFASHGVTPRPGLALLDWGCGHGRVTRHFLKHWSQASILGLDIDAENAAWAGAALPGGRFAATPLWPPAPLPSESLDAVFGLSVMTHLTADAQAAWIDELARLMKRDALGLITFAGGAAAGFSSRWRDPAWWRDWRSSGFDDGQHDPALGEAISDAAYYRNTYQSEADVRSRWSGPFEVVEVLYERFGYQDVAVLRRR